jgi:tRNA(Arg) A34 adenosine deaminase TadA
VAQATKYKAVPATVNADVTAIKAALRRVLEHEGTGRGCKRKAVKAVATHDHGYSFTSFENYSPVGDCTEEVGNCGCMHAEPQLLLHLAKAQRKKTETLGVTYSPCTQCANMIVHFHKHIHAIAGIYWLIDTETDLRGIERLKAADIPCGKL